MQRTPSWFGTARRHAVALTAALFVTVAPQVQATPFYGLSQGSTLVAFDSASPGVINSSVAITGVSGTVVGIDVRPATGELYALSSNSTLYTINPTTGAATMVAMLSVPVSGAASIDFNPTVDRLRIVTSTGQNLRVVPTTGAVTVDTPLAFAAADPNAGDVPNVMGIAYTNSVAGATTTTLYDFELGNNVLTTQLPPNNGTLNTVGALGFLGLTGFDIFAIGNMAYASSFTDFYGVDLMTGAATLIGAFAPNLRITDIAAAAVVPEPGTMVLTGLGLVALFGLSRRRKTASPLPA